MEDCEISFNWDGHCHEDADTEKNAVEGEEKVGEQYMMQLRDFSLQVSGVTLIILNSKEFKLKQS